MPATRTRRRPVVALVGRANVGKSTLWNKLTETSRAMVSTIAHTTRDRNYAPVVWRGESFDVIDTGGLDAEQGTTVGQGIIHQAELAIREADVVLFIVDAKVGVIAQDRDVVRQIKKLNKHVLLVANKVDNAVMLGDASTNEMWSLGLNDPITCSASTGRGIGDLLDSVYAELGRIGKQPVPLDEETGLKIVMMGRPNVGKSSLVNAILGEERVIVSPLPHTTREPMDTHLTWHDQAITLVDTAGMRKRSHIDTTLDEVALERNREALLRSDVAFLVLDATQGAFDQDKHLAGMLRDEHKGLAIVVNKWDLVADKQTHSTKEYERNIRRAFPFLWWAPIIFTSAKKNLRATNLLDLAFEIREERRRQISFNALQRFLKNILLIKKPIQSYGPQSPYIHDITQVGVEPPTFRIQVRGQKADVHESWLRFFENRLREKFGFTGTPVKLTAYIAPMRRDDMPEKMRNRPSQRKRPIGRNVGRY